jgi:hypothetical protein
MQDDFFDKDMGLDLLMNPKKMASDNISIISSQSSVRDRDRERERERERNRDRDDDAHSVKSFDNIVGARERKVARSETSESDISIGGESFSESGSERSHVSKKSSSSSRSSSVVHRKTRVSEEEILNAKREILYKFDRLEKRGIRLPRKFTMSSSLEEMKQEYDRLERDKDIDQSVKYQKKTMITLVSGIELMNNFFDPVGAKLDGWSENINENLDDYDDIFEDLHEKYKGKAKMAPEIRLLMMLGGSAFMFHMTNSMFKTQMPGLEQVLKQNPELAKQFAAATANTMKQNTTNPMMSGLGGMFSSMFGGDTQGGGGVGGILGSIFGGGKGIKPSMDIGDPDDYVVPSAPRPKMRGPSDMEEILREMENNDDRMEMMSTVSESDMADDSSINNLLMNKKGKKGGGRKINLDL